MDILETSTSSYFGETKCARSKMSFESGIAAASHNDCMQCMYIVYMPSL